MSSVKNFDSIVVQEAKKKQLQANSETPFKRATSDFRMVIDRKGNNPEQTQDSWVSSDGQIAESKYFTEKDKVVAKKLTKLVGTQQKIGRSTMRKVFKTAYN